MYINTAEEISGFLPPGRDTILTIGASGDKVLQMQEQLNTIAEVYTAIPPVIIDGIYGENTQRRWKLFSGHSGCP